MPGIFICYRRDDTSPYAGRLYDHLSARFGADRVFMDIDTIRPGDDFVQVISDRVAACDVLIAVIGRRWLASSDPRGARRLDDPNDFVRIEIASALNRKVRVIPALVDGAEMPRADQLPRELASLARRNAIEVTNTLFRQNVARLIQIIEETVGRKTAPPIFRAFQRRPVVQAPAGQAAAVPVRSGAGLQLGWPIFAMAAAFFFIQAFINAQRIQYPGGLLATTVLQCAALFAILSARSAFGLDRSAVTRLVACWAAIGAFWLIAGSMVLQPYAPYTAYQETLGFVLVLLQAAAAVVFGILARLVQPSIPMRAVWILVRTWGIARLVVWIISLADPNASATVVMLDIMQALIGASLVWFLQQR